MRIDMEKQMVKSRIITGQNFIADARQKAKSKEAEEQIASKVQKALDGAATYEISEEGKAKLKDQQRLLDATSEEKQEKKQVQKNFDPNAPYNPVAGVPIWAKSYKEIIREQEAIIETKNEIRAAGEKAFQEYEDNARLYSEEDRGVVETARKAFDAATDTSAEEATIQDAINGVYGPGAHSPETLLEEAMEGESTLEPAEPPAAENEQIKADEIALMETYVDKRHEGDGIEQQVGSSEEDEKKKDGTVEKREQEQPTDPQEQAKADVLERPGVILQELEEIEKKKANA